MSNRRSKAEWQRLIEEQAVSGLTQTAFCEQAGIPVATFGYWKRKFRDEGARRSGKTVDAKSVSLDDWIELSPPAMGPTLGWQIELELGNGVCLRLRQG